MWLAFHAAEAVRVGEVASVPRPMLWRCWLTSVSTCDASEAFGAGQSAARVHVPTAAAAGTDGIGTASAVSASTKTTNRVKVLLIDLGAPRRAAPRYTKNTSASIAAGAIPRSPRPRAASRASSDPARVAGGSAPPRGDGSRTTPRGPPRRTD